MHRAVWLSALVAVVHAMLFIVYLRPDWNVAWSDQEGYKRLGTVLAETGKFTRYPDYPTFVPEVIRTPGYPALVAVVYKIFGTGNDVAVTVVQAFIFAAICVLVYGLARRVASERVATVAAMMTALFSPLPHFAALVLTELWTAFIMTAAMALLLRAAKYRRARDFALSGALLSLTTLVRPVFVLLPYFLMIAVPLLVRSERTRDALRGWVVLGVAASLTLLPWFTYNYVHLDQFTLSPAGGIGRGLWEGAWQGRWPGRVQAQLTRIATEEPDPSRRDARTAKLAAETGYPAAPMLEYVREWRDIHDVWDTPRDPLERARTRVLADELYLDAALTHMREDPVGHVIRRVTRGAFVLWAAEVPIRYSDIDRTPPWAIRVIWLIQVVLLVCAGAGIVLLARSGRWREAVLLTLPLVYVTAVHLPLLCEARQSLPVKPIVVLLAAVALVRFTFPGNADS